MLRSRLGIHVRLTASVLASLCSEREVTYTLLGEQVTPLNKSWSGKAELGILWSTVPFSFIFPRGT